MAALTGANGLDSLQGHFKEIYADKLVDSRPEGAQLLSKIEFIAGDKQLGGFYNQPIMLTHEHGFTYCGSDGALPELNEAIRGMSQNAQVRGTEMVLRSYLSVLAASRSQNSKAAFISETKLLVENMIKSFTKRLEINILYGQTPIATVESVSTVSMVVPAEEWSGGIWSASEGMKIEIFDVTMATLRGVFSVSSVNLDTRTVTCTADLAAAGVIATDVVQFHSSFSTTYQEFAGIHKIITNTGTLFNVNAAAYNLFKGNIVDVGTGTGANAADLSFDKIETGISRAMEKGLNEELVTVICSPKTWKALLIEQDAKRSYDQSYNKAKLEAGAKSIMFHGPNGMVEIISSIYCKNGYAYMVPLKDFIRVGSSEMTFEQPGFEGKFLRLKESHNAYEMRLFTDQALFTARPGVCVLFRYIKA